MPQSYAEYLKSNGASDEDVKLMDTPLGRKTFDAMQSRMADADASKKKYEDVHAANLKWHEEVEGLNQKYLKERDTALSNLAAEQAKVKKLGELGLIELAEAAEPGSTKPAAGETPAFDASKYVDRDTLYSVAEREGDAIAAFADISAEHRELFPNDKISFRELRKEAVARKISVEQLWMDKYNIPKVRADRAAASDKARLDAAREEGRKQAEVELASKYKNPNVAPLVPSSTPFTDRPPSAVSDPLQQPWNRSPSQMSADRVSRVMAKINGTGGHA